MTILKPMDAKTFAKMMYHKWQRHDVVDYTKSMEYPMRLRTVECRTCKILFFAHYYQDGLENYY